MDKLKKIINQLETQDRSDFESQLKANNSNKFLTLFTSYTEPIKSDDEIKDQLECNDNALYVLKSRLYDKVQKFLLENKGTSKNGEKEHENLIHYLYDYPRETAIAMLSEIEHKYMASNASEDLINVYSVLKKAHYYSDKYYTYSQLYNKQVAYNIALEKAEDTLFNFNRTLANYYFSSSPTDRDLLQLLRTEIKNIFALNKSARIELISTIISIQVQLFTDIEQKDDEPVEDLIEKCVHILGQFTNDKKIGYYKPVITFLQFEYYNNINQRKKANGYYDELNKQLQTFLLHSNDCMAFKFLLSKSDLLIRDGKAEEMGKDISSLYFDPHDLYTDVIYKFYSGLSAYFEGKFKPAITLLNDLLNEVSFKNFFYIEIDIKLTLAHIYIKQKEYDMAENLLKSLSRKIGGLKTAEFKNVKEAIKIFTLMMNSGENAAGRAKIKKALEQFNFYNFSERKILSHLQPEFDSFA